MFDITQHEGAGTDHLDESTSMPLINIIQQNSPQVNPNKDNFIEGSSAGQMFYAPTQQLLEATTKIVPVAFRTVYAEWKPRTEGGGLVAIHPLTITSHADYAQGANPEKPYAETLGTNELKKTTYVVLKAEIGGEWVDAMLALAISGQRISRKWQADIRKFRYTGEHEGIAPPVFAQVWELSSEYEENSNNEGYYTFKIANPTVLDFSEDESLLTLAADAASAADAALPSPSATPAPKALTDATVADEDRPY